MYITWTDQSKAHSKTHYCPLKRCRCDLLAAIFVMLKILRLLFAARIEVINNRRLASVKTKTTTEAREAKWPRHWNLKYMVYRQVVSLISKDKSARLKECPSSESNVQFHWLRVITSSGFRAFFTWVSKVIRHLLWPWFYYGLRLAEQHNL